MEPATRAASAEALPAFLEDLGAGEEAADAEPPSPFSRTVEEEEEEAASLGAASPLREDEEEDSLVAFEVSLAPLAEEEEPPPPPREEELVARAAVWKFSNSASSARLRLSMASMIPATNWTGGRERIDSSVRKPSQYGAEQPNH